LATSGKYHMYFVCASIKITNKQKSSKENIGAGPQTSLNIKSSREIVL
jgi:hypothetical protein